MRFISAKGEYAILAMLALALHSEKKPLQVKSIAEKKAIPPRFLEQVMSALKKKGLVESVRGPHGGYRLTRQPDQIYFGEMVQAVEGPIFSNEVSSGRNGGVEPLVLKEVYSEINAALEAHFNSISLQDLCVRKKEKEEKEVLMFHI